MAETPSGEPDPPPPDPWYQFGLAKMFLLMTLAAVVGGAWAGLSRVAAGGPSSFFSLATSIVLVLAAPLAALVGASLFRAAVDWNKRRRR